METTTPAIQDYLAAIFDLESSARPVIGARLARHMKVSPPSITEAMRRMQREGYVRLGARHEVRLTPKGRGIAETMARRHRLIERWLTDVLGLDWAGAHDEAHRLEHAISPVVEERLATLLGMPSTCPHGNPIPGMPAAAQHAHLSLAETTAGEEVAVDRITEEGEADRQLLKFLWDNGIRPGSALSVTEVAPYAGTVSFRLDGHMVTIGLAAAAKIWVYRRSEGPSTASSDASSRKKLEGGLGGPPRTPPRKGRLRQQSRRSNSSPTKKAASPRK
jgi:DtxR family Mn-dependent transcriptional regulator